MRKRSALICLLFSALAVAPAFAAPVSEVTPDVLKGTEADEAHQDETLGRARAVKLEPNPNGGVQAADFGGDPIGSALQKGPTGHPHVTLVQVSGAYCTTCQDDTPKFDRLAEQCAGKASAIEFLDDAMDESRPDYISRPGEGGAPLLKPWFRAHHPVVVDPDADESPTIRAKLSSVLPATLILIDGKVIAREESLPSADRVVSIVRASGIAGTQNFSCGN